MSIALLCVATGDRYWQFIAPFLHSVSTFLEAPHHVYLFTDCRKPFPTTSVITIPPEGYPLTTLHRYHHFLTLKERILSQDFTYVFYSDIDDVFVSPITESDICSDGITATDHAGFHNTHPGSGDYERNPKSRAFIPHGLGTKYYAGGFIGGRADVFFQMAEAIVDMVDEDTRNNVLALWHDESHLNRYLLDHPPARVLTPAYHFPAPLPLQREFSAKWGHRYEPRIVCLEKTWKVS